MVSGSMTFTVRSAELNRRITAFARAIGEPVERLEIEIASERKWEDRDGEPMFSPHVVVARDRRLCRGSWVWWRDDVADEWCRLRPISDEVVVRVRAGRR